MSNKILVDTVGLQVAIKNILAEERKNDNGLAGGYNGSFPLTAATKEHIYLLPQNRKLYVCTSNYSGSRISVPNSNFEELSIYQNRDRLENLINLNGVKSNLMVKVNQIRSSDKVTKITFQPPFKNKCLGVFLTDVTSENGTILKHAVTYFDKNSFDVINEGISQDTFCYLAIGY